MKFKLQHRYLSSSTLSTCMQLSVEKVILYSQFFLGKHASNLNEMFYKKPQNTFRGSIAVLFAVSTFYIKR